MVGAATAVGGHPGEVGPIPPHLPLRCISGGKKGKERKGKERKGKERKGKERKRKEKKKNLRTLMYVKSEGKEKKKKGREKKGIRRERKCNGKE